MIARVEVLVVAVAMLGCGSVSGTRSDAQPQPDAAVPESCSDGVKNTDETDVDCGGTCGGCDEGDSCVRSADCSNGSCFAGRCGERMWFVESTGTDVEIPATQEWTAAPGTSATFTTWASSNVFIRWMGTLRYVGGGASCHVGMRLVIDGVPTGHTTWGDAIVVVRGDTRWHQPFNLELTRLLPAGVHTISAEVVNGTSAATCNLDGDGGAPYDRSHLALAAYDPLSSWYAESSAGTGALAPGADWVDVPGVAVTIPLAQDSLVQLSLQGTQLSQPATGGATLTRGHCAYRFVVDGAPLGHSAHGQALSVGDSDAGWWAPVVLKWGAELPAGTHPVRVQVRNSSTTGGTCVAAHDNHAYSRFRLFATATATGQGLAVESTGTGQTLQPSSAWTTITGLDTQLELAAAAPVQVEVAGTQFSSGSGHCAYRLVVDGTALGDENHGQAINVGDGTNSWWNYAGLLWGAELSAGLHDFRVEARNSALANTCEVNGDDAAYGRTRILVRTL